MLEDIKNSIKAKLYDFTYTPFMSSVIISWIVLNHKYLLIYFGTAPLKQKLVILNTYSFSYPLANTTIPYAMNIWFPILFGLFYVFAYPWASKIFYEYTLKRTKALKTIKQSIEDETPITQEEAKEIRKGIDRLGDARDEALSKLRTAEDRYKTRLSDTVKPIENELKISKGSIEKLTSENERLNHNLSQANQFLKAKNKAYDSLKKQVLVSKNQKEDEAIAIEPDTKVPKAKLTKQKKEDRELILEYLYSSYETTYEKDLLTEITNSTSMARAKARNIINVLLEEGVLVKDTIDRISITKDGGHKLEALFEKKK